MTAQSGRSFEEAFNDKAYWGRLVESAIGAHLLNGYRSTEIELYYWREKDLEVDFVLKRGESLVAIEVNSQSGDKMVGMAAFQQAFRSKRVLLVGKRGIQIEEFLLTPIEEWFK